MDAGFKVAQGKYITPLDGDGQNDPNDIVRLIVKLEEDNLDVVSGWRKNRKDTLSKKVSSLLAARVRKFLINDGIYDSGCTLKVYKQECFQGVDGAIHSVAGSELLAECKLLGSCETGGAKITKGYNLPAKHIIHTVGPIYGHEEGKDDVLLAVCYRNSLLIAKENNLKTIAFPCISTGVFKFPKDKAAEIAINTIESFIKKYPEAFEEIVFVTHEELDYDIYNRYLLELA